MLTIGSAAMCVVAGVLPAAQAEFGVALMLFIPFDGLLSPYLISALFGLFQGGIAPSDVIIVREHLPPAEAGTCVGAVRTATLLGTALGGRMSGKVFDPTGPYHAAFVDGVGWNVLNPGIVLLLITLTRRRGHSGPVALA